MYILWDRWYFEEKRHEDKVIMGAIASQITSLTIVYSTVYPGTDQSRHQSSASLAFVWGINRRIPRTKGQWRRKYLYLMTPSWTSHAFTTCWRSIKRQERTVEFHLCILFCANSNDLYISSTVIVHWAACSLDKVFHNPNLHRLHLWCGSLRPGGRDGTQMYRPVWWQVSDNLKYLY